MPARFLAILAVSIGLMTGSAPAGLVPAIQKARDAAAKFERDIAARHGPAALARARSSGVAILPPGSDKRGVSPQPFRGSPVGSGRKTLKGRDGAGIKDGTSNTILIAERRLASSLHKLSRAVGQLEAAAGPQAPCVRTCRSSEQRCLSRCRTRLRGSTTGSRCSCIPGKAQCLIKAAERGQCTNRGSGARRELRRR